MKILTNSALLRAGVVFCCSAFAFLLGLILIRLLRKSIREEAEITSEPSSSLEAMPMHVYNTVIQQLKQQKHELQVQSQSEQARARTAETLSQALLAKLSSGVLVLGGNGLVKSSNGAAKKILGFASMQGMTAADIFRGTEVRRASAADYPIYVTDEVDAVLHEGNDLRRVEAEYETPSGEQRFLSLTISRVLASEGGMVACLIEDITELETFRRKALLGGISAEMALKLRTSLDTISAYAQQLAGNSDPEIARRVANDIAEETTQLDRSIAEFLAEKNVSETAAAAAGD